MTADDERPFAVFAIKGDDGRRPLFSRYATRKEADDVVAALARFHCQAIVVGPDELPLEEAAT